MLNSQRDLSVDLRALVQEHARSLSASERKVVDLIADSEVLAFLTAAKLARRAGVSESTVIRLCQKLGFDSYSSFQEVARQELSRRLSAGTDEKLVASSRDITAENYVAGVLAHDMRNLRDTLTNLQPSELLEVASLLWEARRVLVLGSRSSAGLAVFLAYALGLVLPDARLFGSVPGDEMNHGLDLGPKDILLSVCYTRCSQRTIAAMDLAKSRGTTVIAVTDALASPATDLSDRIFIVARHSASFLASYTGGMAWANALLAAVGIARPEEASERLRASEEILRQYPAHAQSNGHQGSSR